jgi:hypothetical protein
MMHSISTDALKPKVCLCTLPSIFGPAACAECGINGTFWDESGHIETWPPDGSFVITNGRTGAVWQ